MIPTESSAEPIQPHPATPRGQWALVAPLHLLLTSFWFVLYPEIPTDSLWNSLSDIRLSSRRGINYRFRLGLQPSRTKWGILMTLLFRSGGSPAEAFISHIPAGFSFQLKAVLLIPVGATHPRTKKSKRWLLVGSKAGKYTVLWGETIRLTSSRGSNSVPNLARFFLTFPLHTKQSFTQSRRWSLLSLRLLNNGCKVQEHQSRRNTCF